MKKKILLLTALCAVLFGLNACTDPETILIEETVSTGDTSLDAATDDNLTVRAEADFIVTIENVGTPKPIFQSGVFNTPVGGTGPAPLFPGDAYEFNIDAGPSVLPGDGGTRLSFVTMFVQSNDLFFAPDEQGIALYDKEGHAIACNGPVDVTNQVLLWDAGTEVNEETGGPNQKPQQDSMSEDQGVDENGVVTEVTNGTCSLGNVLPENNEVIKVTIENIGPAKFKVRIENVSDGMTIATPALGEGTRAAVPISPGVYAVHTKPAPFFEEGKPASGAGLVASAEGVENIAEDGFIEALRTDTKAATGLIVPLSPGAWAVQDEGSQPALYQINTPDFGEGLEAIAEDGIPSMLAASFPNKEGVDFSGVFDTGVGAAGPGAIGPGGSYQFTFSSKEGHHLSLATMFVQSNDWFYAFSPNGLPLFEDGVPISGDITDKILLYDAGTEADEYPGAGLYQVIRQSGGDSGPIDSNMNVRLVDSALWPNIPETPQVLKVTIEAVNK